MTEPQTAPTAFTVADVLRGSLAEPWEVYSEQRVGHEIHLVGTKVEMVRTPIRLEGYGLRILRKSEGHIGVGFAPSTDFSASGVREASEAAERSAQYTRFPAKEAHLPGKSAGSASDADFVDAKLWTDPMAELESFVKGILEAFQGRMHEAPSFGSVKADLDEVTFVNSSGLEREFRRSSVEFELAITASGGPEGAPPGESWVIENWGGLPSGDPKPTIEGWCRRAEDIRHAKPLESGPTTVVFPPSVSREFLPSILGFRLSGRARLMDMMPEPESAVASETVTVVDDGVLPNGLESSRWDDEGTPHRRRTVIDHGKVVGGLYDILHAELYGVEPTGSGHRRPPLYGRGPRFLYSPSPAPANLVMLEGDGGSDAEITESVRDGLWVEHLGYAFPDPVSGHFGGEIRLGYRIKNGKLGAPVRGGVVGGLLLSGPNEPSVLRSVAVVGSKSHLAGSLRAPTFAVRDLPVAGSA